MTRHVFRFFIFVGFLILVHSALAQTASPPPALFLPLFQASNAADLGLALSNPTLAEVTVTLTARTYEGTSIGGDGITNPVTLKIPASGQRALRTVEIFGAGIKDKKGWVQLAPSNPAVRGFFLLFDSTVTFIDGAELQSTPAGRLIFPKISVSADSATTVSFVHNGSSSLALAAFTLYDNAGKFVGRQYLNLAPYSGFSGPVTDLVPVSSGFEGYAVFEGTGTPFSTVSETLFGIESYRNKSDIAVLSAVSDKAQTRTGYLAHLASQAGYTTRLGLVNYSNSDQTVTITAAGLESNGSALIPATVRVDRKIPAFGRIEEKADALFSLSGNTLISGYIKFEVQGNAPGLIGYLDYGTSDGVLLSAVPAQSTSYSDLYFSHVAEGLGYYTGLALLNPNTQVSSVTIDVLDRDGNKTGSANLTLDGGQRRSKLLSELLPKLGTQLGGYVHVTATRPIFAFQLFGSRSALTFLANVSAQGIQLQLQASGRTVSASSGANVISRDGSTSIAIPPGALQSDTAVQVSSVTVSTLPDPTTTQKVVAAVKAEPSGTKFQIPVTLTFPLAVQLTPGTEVPVLIFNPSTNSYDGSDGFTAMVDDSGRTASAKVTHFTTFVIGRAASELLTVSNVGPSSGKRSSTVTVTGTGFSATASENIVTFAGDNNTALTAEVSAATTTTLTVKVPDKAVTGQVIVRVGTRSSIGVLFTIPLDNPVPANISVKPNSVPYGTASASVQISGTGFLSISTVNYDGAVVASTLLDTNLLEISLSGSQLGPAVHKISVTNPEPAGGTSNSVEFTVGYPKPAITGISPSTVKQDDSLAVTVSGTGFTSASSLLMDGASQSFTFVSDTTLSFKFAGTTQGLKSIQVSNPAPGGGISGAVTLTVTGPSTIPVGSVVFISANTSATVGTSVNITVEVRSSGNTGLPGKLVGFTVTGGGSVGVTGVQTDSDGRVKTTLKLGTKAGDNTVVATSEGISSKAFTATGLPDVASQVGVTANPASFKATSGTGSTLTAQVQDKYGNAVTGGSTATSTITFTTTSGSVTPASIAAANGAATSVLAGTAAGVVTVGASASTLTAGTASVTILAGDPSTAAASGGTGQTGAAGSSLPTKLKAQFKDQFGNVTPGLTVTFSVVSGGGSVSPTTAVTDSNGEAQTTATLGGSIGTHTFRAAIGTVTVDINATAVPDAVSSVSMTSSASTAVAGGAALSLTITLSDKFGNLATNATGGVAVTVTPTSGTTIGVPTAVTQGVSTSTFTSTYATSYNLVARFTPTAGNAVNSAGVAATITSAAAAALVIDSGNGQAAVHDSQVPAALVVKATDAFGNPVSGVTVTFAVTSGGGAGGASIVSSTSPTGADGKASAVVTVGGVIGATYTYSATASVGTVTFSATAISDIPASIDIQGAPTTAAAGTTTTLTVLVVGKTGAVLGGQQVSVSASGGGMVDPQSVTTGSDGKAKFDAMMGQTAGTNNIFTASIPGTTLTKSVTIGVVAGPAASIAVSAGDAQTGGVGLSLTNQLVAIVKDEFGNVKSGATVTFAVTSGGGVGATVNPTTATTDAGGLAKTTATLGSAVGAYTFTASVATATGPLVSATFTATGQLIPTQFSFVDGSAQTVLENTILQTPVRLKVTNDGGVVIPGIKVTFTTTAPAGVATSASGTTSTTVDVTTDANGIASIFPYVGPANADGSAKTYLFTATAKKSDGTTISSPITFGASGKRFVVTPTTVNVVINTVSTKVGTYQVTINFDKTKVMLKDEDVVPASSGPYNSFTAKNIENANGTVTLNQFTTSPTNPPATFVVATLKFTGLAAGTTTLTTSGITLTDEKGDAAPGTVTLTLSSSSSPGAATLQLTVQ
jgi:hypothetical protein